MEVEVETKSTKQTAKIYQFPAGGRKGRAESKPPVRASFSLTSDFGGSWYHEEAIAEERRSKPRTLGS